MPMNQDAMYNYCQKFSSPAVTMEKKEIQTRFVTWFETKTGKVFDITHPFLLACLDEAVERNLNSTFNGTPFHQHYSQEDFMNQILESWQSTASSFLQLPKSNVNFVFRDVPLPEFEDRKDLLIQLSQLTAKVDS
jgi:hypothetical protein